MRCMFDTPPCLTDGPDRGLKTAYRRHPSLPRLVPLFLEVDVAAKSAVEDCLEFVPAGLDVRPFLLQGFHLRSPLLRGCKVRE